MRLIQKYLKVPRRHFNINYIISRYFLPLTLKDRNIVKIDCWLFSRTQYNITKTYVYVIVQFRQKNTLLV